MSIRPVVPPPGESWTQWLAERDQEIREDELSATATAFVMALVDDGMSQAQAEAIAGLVHLQRTKLL